MKISRRWVRGLAAAVLASGTLIVAGCGDDDDDNGSGAAAGNGDGLSGNIIADGSSTVAPLTSPAAEAFNGEEPGVDIEVRTSGTGGGFEAFCAGETDISNASRAIAEDEVAACESGGIEYTEFRVASDGIVLVTNAQGADLGSDQITLEGLEAVWEMGSSINNWSGIPGSEFNDVPLQLAGAGSQSGTYDFFNETVLGEDDAGEVLVPRQDYAASEDDNVTIRAVTSAPGGMGYFGYSYYEENTDTLGLLAVDGVFPSPETITDDSYPISRPLFIYVKNESLSRPEVEAFVRYYLENAISLAETNAFVPAPQEAIDESLTTLDEAAGS